MAQLEAIERDVACVQSSWTYKGSLNIAPRAPDIAPHVLYAGYGPGWKEI